MNRTKLIILAVSVTVLALQAPTAHAIRVIGAYTRVFEGIEYATGTEDTPRLMKAFAIRVSLRNPDVQMYATPSNGGLAGETTKRTTSAFLDVHNLKAAINANFFGAIGSIEADPWGLVISSGMIVSPAQAGTFSGQLNVTVEKIASIIRSGSNPSGIHTAVGGDGDAWLLTNGVKSNPNPNIDPRSGVGISQDGKFLIMVVVDGRQNGWSNGCNAQEMGQWMLDFGAWNAMVLDGGGSSCLVRDNGAGTPLVMNRPSDGSPRAVGANLGAISVPMGQVGPNACSMNSSRVDVVTRGHLNHIYLKTWTPDTGWYWTDLGGTTLDTPTVVSHANGVLDVFHRGTDNKVWGKWTADGGATWHGWNDLGGGISSGISSCKMVGADRMDIVLRSGPSNSAYSRTWIAGVGWGSYISRGTPAGGIWGTPCIVSKFNGHLEIFARSITGNNLWNTWTTDGGNTWSAWNNLGSPSGGLNSYPVVTSRNSSNIEVFVRGADNQLWGKNWNNGWSGWNALGGVLSSHPGVCSTGNTNINVFIRGTEDHQWQKTWNGTSWGGYINQGAYY